MTFQWLRVKKESAVFVNMSSVALAVHSVQCATEWYIQIVVRNFDWKSRWSSLRWKKETDKLNLANEHRTQSWNFSCLHGQRVVELGRSKNFECQSKK